MVRENTRNGQLQRLSENLSLIRSMDPIELGFTPNTIMPDSNIMEQIRCYLRKMQNHYSPLKKLENLLKAISLAVSRSCSSNNGAGDNANTLSSLGSRKTCSKSGNELINGVFFKRQNNFNQYNYANHNYNDSMSLERLPSLKNSTSDVSTNFSLIAKQLPGEGYIFNLYYNFKLNLNI